MCTFQELGLPRSLPVPLWLWHVLSGCRNPDGKCSTRQRSPFGRYSRSQVNLIPPEPAIRWVTPWYLTLHLDSLRLFWTYENELRVSFTSSKNSGQCSNISW